ncbi:hypothetical protein GCM10009555_069390 [Acrocarpospora macrocephala]|uniref:Uncharacterized protein n=1 Tax=Acrocarpospora macrocephala TaxID=150177 RepID=A0A5M3XDG1_9ACTN|nr:hypothetical protein Amac_097160 [Acrocarpospora macrocephala]
MQLRPEITKGAETMNIIFSDNPQQNPPEVAPHLAPEDEKGPGETPEPWLTR